MKLPFAHGFPMFFSSIGSQLQASNWVPSNSPPAAVRAPRAGLRNWCPNRPRHTRPTYAEFPQGVNPEKVRTSRRKFGANPSSPPVMFVASWSQIYMGYKYGISMYPLVICYIAVENFPLIFPARNLHLWLGFSMAMLNNQMVTEKLRIATSWW